jgi:hypothetical protein
MRKFSDAKVAAKFKTYPAGVRDKLLALRALVFDVAARTDGVGPLTETLKWGQPSYLTAATGSGSTVRIDALKEGNGYAIYFHCQSGLVEDFRTLYPDTFAYQGSRAIVFRNGDRVPAKALRHCVALALTRHARKKKRAR